MPESTTERFADETTVHGVKDFYDAGVFGKVFWGILAVVAVVGLCMQLEGVIIQYSNEVTGATMTQHFPQHVPVVAICPDRWVSAEKARKYGLDRKAVSVINGYMSMLGIVELYNLQGLGDVGAQLEDQAIVFSLKARNEYGAYTEQVLQLWREAGSNLDDLVATIGLDQLYTIMNDIYPMGTKLNQHRWATLSGVCFAFESNLTVNAMQSVYAGVKLAFNVTGALPSNIGSGDRGYTPFFAVNLGPVGEKPIMFASDKRLAYGGHYLLLYSVTKITRVNTKKWPCGDTGGSDVSYCTFTHGNEVAKGKESWLYPGSGCETAIPSSNRHPANKVDLPCNTFLDLGGSSLTQFVNLPYSTPQWNKICPRACSFTTYQYTFQIEKELFPPDQDNGSYTLLEVKAAEGMSGLEINEYLIMGMAGMLSNVGGTMGLLVKAAEGMSGLEINEYVIMGMAGMLSNVGGTMGLLVKAAEGMSGLEINEYLIMGMAGMLSNVGGTMGLLVKAAEGMSGLEINEYVIMGMAWMLSNVGGTMGAVKAAEGMSGLEINEYLIMGMAGMLSNVGGTMGLWIGASVMSFCQILYIFCLDKLFKKKERTVDLKH